MPIHDWTLVSAGTFHDFHTVWIGAIRTVLNDGLLPTDYYAQAEQIAGDIGPDVLTLRTGPLLETNDGSNVAVVTRSPPQVQFTASTEANFYAMKQRTLVIRHSSDDHIVALLEILSPGNKSSRNSFRAFIDKAVSTWAQGYHLLLVDLQPPSKRDPDGVHGALWSEISDESYTAPLQGPFTLAAYSAGTEIKAYVNRLALGDSLPDMPLFLTSGEYVSVPLEATYKDAWRGVPKRWRTVLEPGADANGNIEK
jgi:hypothetical protein